MFASLDFCMSHCVHFFVVVAVAISTNVDGTLFVRSAYGDRSVLRPAHAICEMLTSSVDFVVINMVFLWHTEIHQIGTETANNQNKIKTFYVHIIHFGLWFCDTTPHFIWCSYSFRYSGFCLLSVCFRQQSVVRAAVTCMYISLFLCHYCYHWDDGHIWDEGSCTRFCVERFILYSVVNTHLHMMMMPWSSGITVGNQELNKKS